MSGSGRRDFAAHVEDAGRGRQPGKSRRSRSCSARRAASAPAWCGPSRSVEQALAHLRRAGLCPPRDRAQPLRGREPEGQGRDFRRGTRRNSATTDAPVIFSAHGVPKSVPAEAERAQLLRARRHLPAGHQGAPRGRDPPQARPRDRADRPCRPSRGGRHHGPVAATARSRWSRPSRTSTRFVPEDAEQSRLCDADDAVGRRHRATSSTRSSAAFPTIVGPHKEDICYATTNRQEAVKRVAPHVDAMIVVGAPNSSNSQRLHEVAERAGCPLRRAGAARRRHRLDAVRRASRGSASPPAPRRPRCWSRRSSTPSPQRYERQRRDRLRRRRRACSSRCRASAAARTQAAE